VLKLSSFPVSAWEGGAGAPSTVALAIIFFPLRQWCVAHA
jgi:hypothetical protein